MKKLTWTSETDFNAMRDSLVEMFIPACLNTQVTPNTTPDELLMIRGLYGLIQTFIPLTDDFRDTDEEWVDAELIYLHDIQLRLIDLGLI